MNMLFWKIHRLRNNWLKGSLEDKLKQSSIFLELTSQILQLLRSKGRELIMEMDKVYKFPAQLNSKEKQSVPKFYKIS